jgi:hypothetical protein
MGRYFVLFTILSMFLFSPGDAGALPDVTINFDDVIVTGNFITEGPLRDQYGNLGVHFRGLGIDDGGARLNAMAAQFGIAAYNSPNFLAFNRNAAYAGGGTAQWPEFIVFDDLWKTVTIHVSGTSGLDHFILRAYDSGGKLVDEENVDSTGWVPITVEWSLGIRQVELTRLENGSVTFAADSLELTTRVVPEPGTLLLLGLGLFGIGISTRRRP